MRIKHVLAKKCRFDMQFQCIEAIFTPNDDVFVFIMPLHGCSFLPHQIVVDILVVAYLSQTCAKRKKIVPMRIKKDVRTITQSEEQEKLLSDLLGGIRDRKFYVELALPYVACTTFAQENVLSELLLKWIRKDGRHQAGKPIKSGNV